MLNRLNRYNQVLEVADSVKPKTIIDIGTYKGVTAKALIEVAKKYHERPIYWWFDAFGAVGEEELPYLDFPDMAEIKAYLETTGAEIRLVKGNTRTTLHAGMTVRNPDFIFVDGGHSLETIQNDWNWVQDQMKKNTVVVFDDYYIGDLTRGAKKLIDGLDREVYNVEFLTPPTIYPQYTVYFVKVWKK